MKKIYTLKKNYEFKNVITGGKYFVKNQIIVYIMPNKKNENIIGIAINTKLCNAVKRNFLKRKIREAYRLKQNDLKKGYNIVFLWNKNIKPEDADFQIIVNDMITAFKEAKVLKLS